MNTQLSTSQISSAARRKIGINSDITPSQVNIGTIVWCKTDQREQPLIVEMANGVLFKCGGLTELQFQQLPALMPDLVGTKLVFSYQHLVNNAPIDAQFKTLLLENDSRPSAKRLIVTLGAMKGAVQ
ncbi:MAG: hypothetical protein HRT92_10070 [Piscirickettsiaceae bacterium]|nr:hypothetical protein [Piscirickettsiaceae bacterium]